MTPGKLREKVVAERSEWVREMLVRIRALPLESLDTFVADPRNVDAAESCLRRALEALCTSHLTDVETVLAGLHRWVRANPERVERGV